MSWEAPQWLWLLLAVPTLAAFAWRQRRKAAQALRSFAEEPLLPRLAPDRNRGRRLARDACGLAAIAALVVALAGPRWGSRWEEVRRQGVDLIVALDTSRSMLATDVKPNRLERAKLAVGDLLTYLRGDRIGLVAFAGTAFLQCPLTLDYSAFSQSLAAVQVGTIPRGGTALAAAIRTALEGFEARQGKHEALILVSDGENHEGDIEAAAKAAADRGVKIYTVGVGTTEGELIPLPEGGYLKDSSGQVVKSRLDEGTLEKIAVATGGAYVRGTGASLGLEEIFRDHIAKMEKREVRAWLERRYERRFQAPLAIALALLLLEPLLADRAALRRWPLAFRRAALALLFLSVPAAARAGGLAEGNRLYQAGQYAAAAERFAEALVDEPESPAVRFNLAAAYYKSGQYEEAAKQLRRLDAGGDRSLAARAAYNLGNALFRIGQDSEQQNPQAALAAYEEALAAYKRAMGADPSYEDPKFNHEIALAHLEALKQKLASPPEQSLPPQPQSGEGAPRQESQGASPQDESTVGADQPPQPGETSNGTGAGGGKTAPQSPPAATEGNQQAGPEGRAAGEVPAPNGRDRQLARGILDQARDEEVRPEEISQNLPVAASGEPLQDW